MALLTMNDRAAELISLLDLAPHPEGGHYREVYRATSIVHSADRRGERAAATAIFFLLARGEISRWHRVASDEVWHYYEGAPLELLTADPEFQSVTRMLLGTAGPGSAPQRVVPAGHWQAARPTGDYTLAGCTVAPGFEFADFEMLADSPEQSAAFRERQPEWAEFV